MSCHLLENPTAIHTIVDDRESCLWVLLWVTLKHSKTKLSAEQLKEMMDSFDYAKNCYSCVQGGGMKERLLLSRQDVKLPETRSGLEGLIDSLQSTFSYRYIHGVWKKDLMSKYEASLARMEEASWLNDEFRKHLSKGNWPDSDEALHPDASGHKRNAIQANLELPDSSRAVKAPRSRNLVSAGDCDEV